jgi:PAS domain S-box-containing protein
VTTLDPMPQHNDDPTTSESLRDRIAELEAENAHFRDLEETVRRNARLVEVLLDKSHDGFLLVTPQLTVLRIMHSALGNTDENLAGRPVLTKVHPEDRARVAEAFSRLLSNPSHAITLECRASDRNGAWRWVEVEMTDMLDDPYVQAIVFNSRDITARRQYQEELRKLKSERRCDSCALRDANRTTEQPNNRTT